MTDIPIGLIDVAPARLRRELGDIAELAYSIGSVGLLQPIQVFRVRKRFRLVAGERRLRAAMMLGWTEIPGLVREATGDELLVELVENTQRKHLSDSEEADAFIRLVRDQRYGAKDVAAHAGRSEPYVSKRIRVFEDSALRAAIEDGHVSISLAEELLALQPEQRPALLRQAIDSGWDSIRTREAVRGLMGSREPDAAAQDVQALEVEWADDDLDDAELSFEEVLEDSTKHDTTAGGHTLARPSGLARQIRLLTNILRDVRPYELSPADERALAALLKALLKLARAHATGARQGPVFPSLADAERTARRR